MASSSTDPILLLHGDLDLHIHSARNLPNMDLLSDHLRRCLTSCPRPNRTHSRHRRRHVITSDAYVTVSIASAVVARTRVIPNSPNPDFDESFIVPLAHSDSHLVFNVKDDDLLGADLIGIAKIPISIFLSSPVDRQWFPILSNNGNGKPPKPDCAILVSLKFTPCSENPVYGRLSGGVPNCYFSVRNGGMVRLYQDAHVREGELGEVEMEEGRRFEHRRCWEDICHGILEAHHLIYVIGWSIYHKVRLVREPTRPLPANVAEMSLGELLKYKSQEGVRVCLLVWDDKTSHDRMFIKTEGVMQTHDEETRRFFKHSSVICVLSPRYASSKLSIIKQRVVGTLYTHHQKCVLVDTQASGNNRKITAFIGGLDLCDGRYDTPQHRLFSDLDTVFANDFHNPTFATETRGPRQPWHDLHCKIEGPAAYDVLTNFEQRWRKATKWRAQGWRFKKVSRWNDDALLKLERISWIISPKPGAPIDHPSLRVTEEGHPQNWHVQIFRSIDSGSAKGEGFSKMLSEAEKHSRLGKAKRLARMVEEARKRNLVCQKNLVVDKSIHTAYVKAIRSAQRFIYIENQYFLGSSYNWPDYKYSGADNLIPMELALKVASKIRAQERFAVYVVIPMWPEGAPAAASVQEILFWQAQTIQMMYGIIGQELKSMNMEDTHPQDYLNFYCLGNREEVPKDNPKPTDQLSEKSTAVLSQKYRRFMIYVHAKGMIVDDEYVILGSANINQRSLSGSRDTEIAMGAYQPYYTWTEKNTHPRGQVYGYRTSLWEEHLGMVDECFKEPNNLECVRFVNKIAVDNWTNFTAEEIRPLTGHLLKYPVKVEANGKVGPLPDYECFPDVGDFRLPMMSDSDDAGFPLFSNSTVIFVVFMGTICVFMFVLSIIKIMVYHCTQPRRQSTNSLENSLPRFKTEGLASSVIISLPAVQFKKRIEGYDDENRSSECAICLGVYRGGEWMRILPNCSHGFHVSCIDVWLQSSSICPLCRTDVLIDNANLRLSIRVTNSSEILPGEEARHEIAPNPLVDRSVSNVLQDDVK